MRIKDACGVGYKDAIDYCINEMQHKYDLNRRDAMRLFAESVIRNCVQEELFATADVLIGETNHKRKEVIK